MSNMPWFRFYSEMLHDKKIKKIYKELSVPPYAVIGIWTVIMCVANESPVRGLLLVSENIRYDLTDLSDDTGLNEKELEKYIAQFDKWEMLKLIDGVYHVLNWGKRQYKSDNITSRVESFRGKPEVEPEEVVKPKKKPAKPKEYPILADGLPEWVPDQLRAICRAFQEESGISTPVMFDTDWNKSLLELSGLGATPDVIIEAVRRLRSKKMTVARPGGVNRTVVSILAEENIKEPKMDADGNLVRI